MNKISDFWLIVVSTVAANSVVAADKVIIEAGSFQMGCSVADNACENDEGKPGGISVFVPPFSIDKQEVSVAEYMACIEAGKCSRPKDHQRNQYCNV